MSHYYATGNGLGLNNLGNAADKVAPPGMGIESANSFQPGPMYYLWSGLSLVGTGTGAYHGYKRNNSVGWAIGWAIFGGLLPVIAIPVSLAQGYAKPKVRRNRRRRSSGRRTSRRRISRRTSRRRR